MANAKPKAYIETWWLQMLQHQMERGEELFTTDQREARSMFRSGTICVRRLRSTDQINRSAICVWRIYAHEAQIMQRPTDRLPSATDYIDD